MKLDQPSELPTTLQSPVNGSPPSTLKSRAPKTEKRTTITNYYSIHNLHKFCAVMQLVDKCSMAPVQKQTEKGCTVSESGQPFCINACLSITSNQLNLQLIGQLD